MLKQTFTDIYYFFNKIRYVNRKGSFVQNLSFTFGGNLFALCLSLIFAPIVSRIYPPEVYGSYSIFNSIVTNISTFSLLAYNFALIIPKEEEISHRLTAITILLSLTFSMGTFLFIIIFSKNIINLFSIEGIGNSLCFIAPAILLTSLTSILSQWFSRQKEFKKISLSNSISNLMTRIIVTSTGLFLKADVNGFIFGDIIGRMSFIFLIINKKIATNINSIIKDLNFRELLKTAKQYKKYPLLILPGEYLNLISTQLPIYFISIFFGNRDLGYFALASSVLDIPMQVLANAIRPVYFQKASVLINENDDRLGNITKDLYKYLLLLGIVPFTILTVYGDIIFSIVFGEQWLKAGLFAGILGYYCIFRLVSSPISSVLLVLKKEKSFLIFQIILFITRLVSLVIGIFLFQNLVTTLIIFSIANIFIYLILILTIFRYLKLNYVAIAIESGFIIFISFAGVYLFRLITS